MKDDLLKRLMYALLGVFVFALPVWAHTNEVFITTDGQYRYITSNGIPDHTTGQFPNNGNPNHIEEQNYHYRVPLYPQKTGHVTQTTRGNFGVAINGVPFDPGTAEYYNNDRTSGWNYEALSGKINLGLDQNNAHVQPNGAYHYHGIPIPLAHTNALIGYAADGFPIYYLPGVRSSYRIKSGERPSGPGGVYDGTFVQDYEYVPGLGTLDQCNGMEAKTKEYPQGTYLYVVTKTFPFIPRCWMGTPDASFKHHGPQGAGNRGQRSGQGPGGMSGRMSQGMSGNGGLGGAPRPPQEAVNACQSKSSGAFCRFPSPRGDTVSGTCANLNGTLACRPAGGPPGGRIPR